MVFPLVDRELTQWGRRRSTYFVRALAPLLVAGLYLVVGMMEGARVRAASVGNGLAATARLFQFFIAFVYAPLLAGGLIMDAMNCMGARLSCPYRPYRPYRPYSP